ncbi:MAG: hypothetical protein GY811_09020 [Myxococcales bacterium]|nr:hypothetical protein [Myxococcales bacterium]
MYGTGVALYAPVRLLPVLLVAFLSVALSCTPKRRSSVGAGFAVVGIPVTIAGVQGLQGSSADNQSNDAAVGVLIVGIVLVGLGAILYADAKKPRSSR